MRFEKFVLLFFMFGCWTKYFGGPVGFVGYNIWYVIVLFWSLLNGLGVLNFVVDTHDTVSKEASMVSEQTITKWFCCIFLASTSFLLCGERWLVLAFFLTSFLFATIVAGAKKLSSGKKKK